MLTTSHILIGAAAAARPSMKPWQIMLAWLGGFVPDASIFLLVAVTRVQNIDGRQIWRSGGLYWQEPWQTFSAISNSVPLWLALIVLGVIAMRRPSAVRALGIGLLAFSVAGLLHVIADFLTHADDAHMHFWPFSDWRFQSPVSYYQRAHYGDIFSIFEGVLDLALAVFLIVRFRSRVIGTLAVLLAVPPLAMQILAPMFF